MMTFFLSVSLLIEMAVESVVLTLQVSPIDATSDELVRQCGSNPKVILRLMDTEPVDKVYTHLSTKWNLPSLNLFCKGRPMRRTDLLADYADLVLAKQAIVYQVGSHTGDATTAAPSPLRESVQQTVDRVESVAPLSLGRDAQTVVSSIHKNCVETVAPKLGRDVQTAVSSLHSVETVAPKLGKVETVALPEVQTAVPLKADAHKVATACATSTVPTQDKVGSIIQEMGSLMIEEPRKKRARKVRQTGLVVGNVEGSTSVVASFVVEPSVVASSVVPVEIHQIYKRVMDDEKQFFLSILDSQNRLFSQLQSQMTKACLEIQEKANRNSQ